MQNNKIKAFNKNYYNHNKGQREPFTKNILEIYFKTGEVTCNYINLNSKITKDNKINTKSNDNEKQFLELEKRIKNTDVKLKEKIMKIFDIENQLSIKHLEHFEEIAESNEWTDTQMAMIYHGIIMDERMNSLSKTSFITLRRELLNILYPTEIKRTLMREMDKISQIKYTTIKEYKETIEDHMVGFGHLSGLSKKDSKLKIEEIFLKGLGDFTHLELTRQQLIDKSVEEIFNYLIKLEKEIMAKTSINKNDSNMMQKHMSNHSDSQQKWCSLHKYNLTHDTRKCYVLNEGKKKPDNNNQNSNKNMIIKESYNEVTEIIVEGKINNEKIELFIDSGAKRNYIDEIMAVKLNLQTEDCQEFRTIFGNGETLKIDKMVKTDIELGEKKLDVIFYVLRKTPVKFLLGNSFLSRHDVIIDYGTRHLKINDKQINFKGYEKGNEENLDDRLVKNLCYLVKDEDLINLLNIYKADNLNFSHFSNIKARFVLDKPLKAIKKINYTVPFKYEKQAKIEIKRLMKEGIIEKSFSHIVSPAFFIEKKNGDLRLVVDYREVNKYLQDDPWVIPNIEDSLTRIGSNKFYSKLDLAQGFNQIEIDDESKIITSFFLMGQQYQYKRIPFGIKPGPKLFQRYVSNLLGDIENVFVYIDDIIIYGKTKEEHNIAFKNVLKVLYNSKIKINFEKAVILQNKIEILGYMIDADGIYPKTDYLEHKIFFKEIKTKKDLQRLLGVLNWYRKFIPDLSRKIYKITNMLAKTYKEIKLDKHMNTELNGIKEWIRAQHKMSFPDYKKKFVLQCDASDIGLGAVLTQEGKIIRYYSKKFSKAEINYTIVEKEFLAILLSLIKFKSIIQGSYVEVQTDSKTVSSKKEKLPLDYLDLNYC